MFSYFKELYNYRELLYNIILREIKIRYKQTALGITWAVLQPLSLMVLFTIVFSKFVKLPTDGIPHPIFYFSGLLPWMFFATSLSFAIPILVTNKELVSKIYFPREIFPLACVFAALIDFCIALVIFAGMLIIYKIKFAFTLIYLLYVLIIQIIFTSGVSLFVSGLNVYYRDVRYAMPLLIQLWMFASPIIYPVSTVPLKFIPFYMLNPMAVIIDSYRKIIVQGTLPDFYYLHIAAILSIITFIVTYIHFKHIEMGFADVV